MSNEQRVVVHGGAQPGAIAYSDRTFESVDVLIEYIESIPEECRYDAQAEVLGIMLRASTRVAEGVESFFAYIQSSGVYRQHVSEQQFAEVWSQASEIVEANQQRRNRLQEARANLIKRWDTPRAASWVARPEHTQNLLASVRQLAMSMAFEVACPRINCAILSRFISPTRGVSKIPGATVRDFDKVREGAVCTFDITPDIIAKYDLRYGAEGLLEYNDGSVIEAIEGVGSEGGFTRPAGERFSTLGSNAPTADLPIPMPQVSGGTSSNPALASECNATSPSDYGVDLGLIDDAERELLNEQQAPSELARPYATVRSLTAGGESCLGDEDESNPRKRRRVEVSRNVGKCSCSDDVPEAWKRQVMQKRELGLAIDMRLLRRMQEFRRVCYAHAKAMGGHLGLMVKNLDYPQLLTRMADVHASRNQLGMLKTHADTFSWFRVVNRPARPSDTLGPYKYTHKSTTEFRYDQPSLLSRLGVDANTWAADGSINVSIFDWWFQGPIGKIIELEFSMYRHHLREINGKPNYGWLRNCFYSVGQQLMRQDPVYYALYAALRPDQQWRLVSYPYYAKYAIEGDRTYFRHIDLNIPDLLSNSRGACMIQGSVSLDDESSENCTVILPGMQHKLQEWWDICIARGQDTTGFVHRITEQMFTKDDATSLGTDWKYAPCRRGEVRVTMPHIPHGADGPSVGTRRTMLPWFVGVQDDNETLEVIEGGTWSDLSIAHRDLTSPKATPSGLANRYGAPPYRFPAAVELSGLGALSDALVCRRRWNSPAVLAERDALLCSDPRDFERLVTAWRKRATKAAEAAFVLVREEEKAAFGDRSYFYHLERFEQQGIPFPAVVQDAECLDARAWESDRTVDFRFAEEGSTSSGGDGGHSRGSSSGEGSSEGSSGDDGGGEDYSSSEGSEAGE